MSNESDRAAFEAWIEETSGFSSDDESIAWSSWKARASLFNAASAEGAIYQIRTEEGAWLNTTREYYERVKSDPALARVVYAAPQPPAQAKAPDGLTDEQREVIEHAVACLELSELSAERELAHELRVIADRVAQPHPKCHGCPINPTCPSTTCGVSQPEPRAEVTDGWTRVDEKLPPYNRKIGSHGVEVLIWPAMESGERTAFFGRRISQKPMFYRYGAPVHGVTHWMPVPDGPNDAARAGGAA